MSPLTVGAAVAAVMAGPPLYSLVENGQLDSTTALVRGLIVAAVCTMGASYIQGLMAEYEHDQAVKTALRGRLLAEAERRAQIKQLQDKQAQERQAQGRNQSP